MAQICHSTFKPASALKNVWKDLKTSVTVDKILFVPIYWNGLMEPTEDNECIWIIPNLYEINMQVLYYRPICVYPRFICWSSNP